MLKSLLTFDEDVTKDECGIKWTKKGEPQISNDICKFGRGAMYGQQAGIYTNELSDFLNKNSFTIELWYYFVGKYATNEAEIPVFNIISTSNLGGCGVTLYASHLQLNSQGGGLSSPNYCKVKKFVHIAVCFDRSTKQITMFEDGVLVANTSYYEPNNLFTTLKIGLPYHDGNIGDYVNNGYIDEFMITSGIKYTKDFIPPSAPTRFDKIAFLTKGNQLYARN